MGRFIGRAGAASKRERLPHFRSRTGEEAKRDRFVLDPRSTFMKGVMNEERWLNAGERGDASM
jgi:hypothetical protein